MRSRTMIDVTERVALDFASITGWQRDPHAAVGYVSAEVDGMRFDLSDGDGGIDLTHDGYDGENTIELKRSTLMLVLELQERQEQWHRAWSLAEMGEHSSFHPVQVAKAAERAAQREAERAEAQARRASEAAAT